ncbi:Flp pilus assembly protein CpaB [Granulosicoccus sp. 3-233]|uniref:Flp pilus assembly protein CpaB n=1 Tax=Granulosicoccus sp. 3-233 TaxID=3417969 RepID=UPI003D32AA92
MSRGTRVKRRPGKQILMFVLSLALGAGGVYYSRQYIEEQVSYYKGQLDKTEPMVEVVVPNRAMVRGEILLSSDLSVRQIPEKYADTNSVNGSNYEVAIGQRIDFDIDEGRPLLWAHLEGGLTPTFSGKVEDGLRAMTVRVDEINSISGFLQPRDKVDLFLSFGVGDKQQILPLIQRLNVIATGVQTLVDKSSGGSTRNFSTITVHVSPEDGQRITLAQQFGKLTAMLRNPDDEAPVDEAPMTVSQLLKLDTPPVKSAPAPVSRPRTVSENKPGIEFIIGGR